MASALAFHLEGIERALGHSAFAAGAALTIADMAFVCDLAQLLRERSRP